MFSNVFHTARCFAWALMLGTQALAADESAEPAAAHMSEAVTLPAVLAVKASVDNGGDLYETCAACHQANGHGVSDGTVPAIAGQHYRYLAGQLVAFRLGERQDQRMQHFIGARPFASPQAIADVAAYAAELAPVAAGVGPEKRGGTSGEAVFDALCRQCHSNAGEGNAALGVPRIAGQYPGYLVRRINNIVNAGQHVSNDILPMLLQPLPESDVVALAEFIAGTGAD